MKTSAKLISLFLFVSAISFGQQLEHNHDHDHDGIEHYFGAITLAVFEQDLGLSENDYYNQPLIEFIDDRYQVFHSEIRARIDNGEELSDEQFQLEYANFILETNQLREVTKFPPSAPFPTPKIIDGPCVNMDFETGDFTGWELTRGNVNGAVPYSYVGEFVVAPGAYHSIMGGGNDPVVGIPRVNPMGGNFSVRLGNGTGTGARGARMRQTFLVDATNYLFQYSYAVIFQSPNNHTLNELPYFTVRVFDESGTSVPCGEYSVIADAASTPDYQSVGTVLYKNWETVFTNLSAFIGQNVTIEFTSGDCSLTGHYGYAYVDASCTIDAITATLDTICTGQTSILSAPDGVESYLWSTGETTQSISVSAGGTYTCQLTPYQGGGCSLLLEFILVENPTPTANFNASAVSGCLGDPIDFTNLSSIPPPGSITGYQWNFGDGISTPLSLGAIGGVPATTGTYMAPTHLYAAAGNYNVQLYVESADGCSDVMTIPLTINNLPAVVAGPDQVICGVGNVTLSGAGATNYVWDNGVVNGVPFVQPPGIVTYTVIGTDANGCQNTDQVEVTVAPLLSVEINPDTPYLCFGQPFVTLTSNVVGGLAPLSYVWSNAQTTPSINATSGGNYSLTVSDGTGCPAAVDNVNVIEFVDPITANAGPNLTVCEAISSNVQINGVVTGVTTGIWSGGTGTYSASTTDLSLEYTLSPAEILAGSVTLTLTTTNNGTCPSDADQVTITVSEVSVSLQTLSDVTCFGGASGSALISATGGVGPYNYSLNGAPGVASNLFNGLAAGAYTVTVTDALGCQGQVNFTISQPPQLTFVPVTQHVSCFGLCDGEITVNAAGGTLPYMYSGNNGTTFNASNILSNRCAGITGVVVQDANGCLTNLNVNVTQPPQLTATYTLTNPVCHDDCNGEVSVNAAGGTPVYEYSANGGAFQASLDLTGLCSGNNTIVVQDANGCQVSSVQILVNPADFSIDTVYSATSFCGFNNGSIEVIADGLNGPFTYSMDGGPDQLTGEFTNLFAGAYSFVATDALGCQAQGFFGVNDVEMDGIIIEITDALCFGGADGYIEVINSSGINPITFELDNNGFPQASGIFLDVSLGSHIVTITDNGACIFTLPFTINEPDQLDFTVSSTETSCFGGSDGTITIANVTGGVGTYEYSIDGVTYQASPIFTGLTAGMYDAYVIDTNLCVLSQPIEVVEPTPVDFDFSVINLTCFNNNTGVIQLDASGGNGGYTYSIDNGGAFQPGSTFFGLPADDYDVVVQDLTGCTASGVVTVTEPPLLTSGYASVPVTCFGTCDGEISFTAAGGTPVYMYSVDNGVTYSINPDVNGLCTGTYDVQVIDDNGCMVTSIIDVTTPTQVEAFGISTPSTCGLANGEIDASALGGIPGYTYSIDDITYGVNNIFGGLVTNSYTIYAMDDNGCVASVDVIVDTEPSPVITGTSIANTSCNAVCDGEITMTSTGGTGVVQYSIGGAYQLSNVFSGLCAGIYNLSVIDDNGCITNGAGPIEITEPTQLEFFTDLIELTCFQNGTGSIVFNASEGTPAYEYSIDNGVTFGTNPIFEFLDAATYDLVVMDANGCQVTDAVTIVEPPLLEITDVVTTDAVCFGYCDGTANVVVQGGTAPFDYSYEWTQGGIIIGDEDAVEDLCPDVYSILVTDDNGCFHSMNFEIFEPAPMVIDSIHYTDPVCFDACDGTIEVFASTAVVYSFYGGALLGPSSTIDSLCDGPYYILVQDINGCIAYDSTTVDMFNPAELLVVAGPDSMLCLGGSGILNSVATGGTGNHTYNWDNGVVGQNQTVTPGVPTTYVVTVEDENGCVSEADTTVFRLYDDLAISVTNDTIICPSTSLTLNSIIDFGEPGYSYNWLTGGNSISTDSSVVVNPSEATTYIIEVTDFCTTVSETIIVNTFFAPEVTFAASEQDGCTPMTVTIEPTIDPSIFNGNCLWTFSDGTQLAGCGGVTGTFATIGCYEVTFTGTSTDGCALSGFAEDVFCVHPNPVANFVFNPDNPSYIESQVQFTNYSNNADFSDWTFTGYGTSTETHPMVVFNNSNAGDTIFACLQVSTIYGCVDEICHPIVMVEPYVMYVPNTFTPDGNGYNQIFKPVFPPGYMIADFNMMIFNRWGEVIFESRDIDFGWDGTYNGRACQDGTYTWKIQVTDGMRNQRHQYVGHVNIIK